MSCKEFGGKIKHEPRFQNSKGAYLEDFKDHFGKSTLLAQIKYLDMVTNPQRFKYLQKTKTNEASQTTANEDLERLFK